MASNYGGPLVEVGKTPSGYTIWVQDNEVGGNRYWSDSIGGGVVVWDTSLVSAEEVRFALVAEGELLKRTDMFWVAMAILWFLVAAALFVGGFLK